jgi:hypothetical protein
MKANPGGQIAPEEIIGRDDLINKMWSILEGSSIYMNDLRRIGKTQIMVKMHASPPQGWLTVKRDLGGFHTAAEFATQAFRDSETVLGSKQKSLRQMGKLLGKLQGLEIAGIVKLPDGTPAPWKEVLSRTFSDVDEQMRSLGETHRILFFWDEVPFLLDNIAKRESPQVAMELLDALRALGQDYDRVRLLLTGSIGLHHILKNLQQEGYINSPLNRMQYIQPGPLDADQARTLARELIIGNELICPEQEACAAAIADSVGYVAFYIHKLVSRLPKNTPLNPVAIGAALNGEITSDNNDWDLAHYRNRIREYYGDDESLVLHILDAIALAESLDFEEIRRAVSARVALARDDRIRGLLRLLCQDHYLTRTKTNRYCFYLFLIRRWWVIDRNLR